MRGWREDDLDAVAAWTSDPEVMRFLGGTVDRDHAWRLIAMYAGHWQLRGYGLWAVERKADGVLLGRVGLWNPEGWPGLEVGWTLARHAWGQGYAQEAARAAIGWTREVLRAPRLISVIDPANERSLRAAEQLGMTLLGDHLLNGELPTVLYGLELSAGA
jgi:RimJ/RimL family protein N-acetyltransferase